MFTTAAVAGPMVSAHWMSRDGDHARYRWCSDGRCAATVVCRPRSALRTWLATRWLLWKHSTVVTVSRTSRAVWTNGDGTLTYSFVESLVATYPYYLGRLLGGLLILGGMCLMAWHMWRTWQQARAVAPHPVLAPHGAEARA